MALLFYYTPLASSIMGDMIWLTTNNMGREAHQTCMKKTLRKCQGKEMDTNDR